jgi:DNA-binding transcriptional LysR family regulator
MFKQLDSGAIDLAFLAMDSVPSHLHHRILYNEHYVLIARKGHPGLKRKLTLETFCELDHIIVSPDGGGFKGMTDAMLESRRRKRRVSLSTQHFLYVPEVVAQTDLVAVAPYRMVKDRADRLQILTPPLTIPSYDMAMIWHERSHADAAHAWLREQV